MTAMRACLQVFLLLCILIETVNAQNDQPSLNIGSPAPPLRIREWLKGTPIQEFEKNKLYVIEFWATWCAPCKSAMPRLSALARDYKDKVTFLGVDVYENKNTSVKKVRDFVDSMGNKMDYLVAEEDSNFMEKEWLEASGNPGIPQTFVVNREGKLAWIGHPKDIDTVLPKIVSNDWDIREELTKRNLRRHIKELDDSLNNELMKYRGDSRPKDFGKPDSALFVINEMIKKEPKLKYAPFTVFNTLYLLLKTKPKNAYAYGKEVMIGANDDEVYDIIVSVIEISSKESTPPPEIYRLGTEAYQALIDHIPYPEIVDLYKYYYKMAEWYLRANDKAKTIEALQKAIEIMKKE